MSVLKKHHGWKAHQVLESDKIRRQEANDKISGAIQTKPSIMIQYNQMLQTHYIIITNISNNMIAAGQNLVLY